MQPASITIAILAGVRVIESVDADYLLGREAIALRLEVFPLRPARQCLGRREHAVPCDQRLPAPTRDDAIADVSMPPRLRADRHDALRARASASALSIAATRDFLLSTSGSSPPPHRRLPGDVGDRGVLGVSPLRPASAA